MVALSVLTTNTPRDSRFGLVVSLNWNVSSGSSATPSTRKVTCSEVVPDPRTVTVLSSMKKSSVCPWPSTVGQQ